MDEISSIKTAFSEALASAAMLDGIERLRIQYLGRNGALTAILRALKDLPEQERKIRGDAANRLRAYVEDALHEKRAELERTTREGILVKERLDVTRPGLVRKRGHLHPVTQITREVIAIFAGLGFAVAEGPEVETEYYNFDALNIPADHPARDMWDTFWIKSPKGDVKTENVKRKSERLLLRTHTSPVQIRYMESHQPPIRIIVPGTVYRYEATDASHEIQFAQVEGLFADSDVSVAHFKAVIGEFFARLFTPDTVVRLRPSYFPFTEPSFEMDISCTYCSAKGCSVCKQSGWLEIGGAGMVHPHVFKAIGYNPKDVRPVRSKSPTATAVPTKSGRTSNGVQGFAFGMGLTRLALMKYKIPDIRLFNSGDLRFLKQF